MRHADASRWGVLAAYGVMLLIILASFVGCQSETQLREVEISHAHSDILAPPSCVVTATRYPTAEADMAKVYQGRTFYADGNHLGYDIKLPEGTAIAPIACGVVRAYRSAKGYGQLVVVLEHALASPLVVTNGKGEQVTISAFLSLYGHLRSAPTQGGGNALAWKVGDTVGPNDTIGYVNDDAHNGDGAEHVHFGIRLQTASAAQAVDPKAWFRGYDGDPSQRKWFADPAVFMPALMSKATPVLWHPAGTVLHRPSDNSYWMVDGDANRRLVNTQTVASEELASRAVNVSDAELSCSASLGVYVSPRAGHQLAKFDDQSTVYEYSGLNPGDWRKAFISYEAFRSWGWKDADIQAWPASSRPAFFAKTQDHGLQTLRDGSLVKADIGSEVSVVSQGQRLPIIDWATFVALGYNPANIITVSSDVIDAVAGPKGALVTPAMLSLCAHPSACINDCPPPDQGGGSGAGGDNQGETGGVGGAGGSSPNDGSGGAGAASAGTGGAGGDMESMGAAASSSSSSSSSSSGAGSSTSSGGQTSGAGFGGAGGAPQNGGSGGSGANDPGEVDAGPVNPGNGVPAGKVHFHYEGLVLPGLNHFYGMWNPPGPVFYDWVPSTFALCQDTIANDGKLDCLLDMPSGTTAFLFTLQLPDGRWWGDWSCAPTGGCGAPIGTITLTGPNGPIEYQYQENQFGPEYQNGWLPVVP